MVAKSQQPHVHQSLHMQSKYMNASGLWKHDSHAWVSAHYYVTACSSESLGIFDQLLLCKDTQTSVDADGIGSQKEGNGYSTCCQTGKCLM